MPHFNTITFHCLDGSQQTIHSINDFETAILKQGTHGDKRYISQDSYLHDECLDGSIAYPQWQYIQQQWQIVGYVIPPNAQIEKSIQIGEHGILGLHLNTPKNPIVITENMRHFAMIAEYGFSCACTHELEHISEKIAIINIDDLDHATIANKTALNKIIHDRMKSLEYENHHLIVTNMNDIQIKPIYWLWHGWIAKGKLTLLAGAGGCGKTNLLLSIIASITTGNDFPDKSPCKDVSSALIFSTEDDPHDTLKPRLIANGANLSKIGMITGVKDDKGEITPFNPRKHLQSIRDYAKAQRDLKIIMIDPIVSFIHGDTNDNSKVRDGLEPLVDFAMETNIAIVGITHFSKGGLNKKASDRVMGAQAFNAVARTVLVATKKENENKGILTISKSNITTCDKGITYSIEQVSLHDGLIPTTKTLWHDVVNGSATELLAEYERPIEFDSEIEEVKHFLQVTLSANDKMTAKEVYSLTGKQGYSISTVNRAKTALGIKSQLEQSDRHNKMWYWILPPEHCIDNTPF
ncbi:MAG: AAA family ATPase [Acinetobacter sp.]|nr:AAA family ATPase [Acinetobacter sp.]